LKTAALKKRKAMVGRLEVVRALYGFRKLLDIEGLELKKEDPVVDVTLAVEFLLETTTIEGKKRAGLHIKDCKKDSLAGFLNAIPPSLRELGSDYESPTL